MMILTLCFAVTLILGILARIFYLVLIDRGMIHGNKLKTLKTLIILGSGGHTTEMLRILKHLDFKRYTPRIYIYAQTDKMSFIKLEEIENNENDFKTFSIFRSREVGQSYLTSVGTTLLAIHHAIILLWSENPDLILCNGPGTGVPLCIGSFFFKIFFISNTKIIFIESFCRKMAKEIAPFTSENIQWEIVIKYCKEQVPNEIKVHIIPICSTLETAMKVNKKPTQKWIENRLLRLEACIDRTWEALNTGHWKDVPIEQRYTYTICSALKCILLEISSEDQSDDKNGEIRKIIEQLDKGLLLGAPLDDCPDLLTNIATKLNEKISIDCSNDPAVLKCDSMNVPQNLLSGLEWIKRYNSPSLETFYREIFTQKVPAVLEGCIDHWRALTLWKDSNYLIKIAGTRTVPVEIGSKYTEEDWSQHLVTFSDFIKSHVTKNNDKIGYLAQHQLFEQIPELQQDFSIPDYCSFSDDGTDNLPDINAWFGPEGTVSPLHHDPKNNLLSQVFGCKRVILYHPDERNNLYPYDTRLLCNTAQVDPTDPDYSKFPDFKKAQGIMCYLKEGEMLFIPPGWWHHVVSCTPSFSISFWW